MSPVFNDCLLSIDFSLDTLDVALQAPDGEWLIGHRAFTNNRPSFSELRQMLLIQLRPAGESARLTAVGESSGSYWWHPCYHLSADPDLAAFSPHLALLDPKHVKPFRKALPEDDKTDTKDPRLIGRYYRSVGVKHFYTFDLRYLPLRQLTRAYPHPCCAESLLSDLDLSLGQRVSAPPALFRHVWGYQSAHPVRLCRHPGHRRHPAR